MLNASVDVERVLGRLRRPRNPGSTLATSLQVRSRTAAHGAQDGLRSLLVASRLFPTRDRRTGTALIATVRRRSVITRLGPDRTVALAVAGILLGASVVSVSAGGPRPATGGTNGNGTASRLAIGGGPAGGPIGVIQYGAPAPAPSSITRGTAADSPAARDAAALFADLGQDLPISVTGPFLDDGTLLKPVAVNTTVADGRNLVRTYLVKAGDTLDAIAAQFGVSMMTVWWANGLKSKEDIHEGLVLRIPPVTGLIVTVAATDTLDTMAARYDVDPDDILAANQLTDPKLVVGQVLVIPGAAGRPIPVPKPVVRPTTRPTVSSTTATASFQQPATYVGGTFLWPVLGGNNYVSQYFHYGHYAIDIAADYGATVRAGGAGTVVFAGWKSNGGGYQVWIAHGSNLYTTYNHMSAVTVGAGQQVDRGTQVGRVGQSGHATGPHVHFEVWIGPVWNGGTRVNPLRYL